MQCFTETAFLTNGRIRIFGTKKLPNILPKTDILVLAEYSII